jgi:hypothetical protein
MFQNHVLTVELLGMHPDHSLPLVKVALFAETSLKNMVRCQCSAERARSERMNADNSDARTRPDDR